MGGDWRNCDLIFSGVVFHGVYSAVVPLDQSPRMAEHAGLTPRAHTAKVELLKCLSAMYNWHFGMGNC